MIIYNNNREFIGIDEDNLKSLGYSNLAALLTEAADFADLFVKTPGHVHNFKHVHWIDFILCATDKNSSKAIIHANGKSYSCVLDIKTVYLTSAPNKQSYQINLTNLRALSGEEVQNISGELQSRPAPVAAPIMNEVEPKVEPDEEPEIKTPTEASQSDEEQLDISDLDTQAEDLPKLETSQVEQDPYEIEDEFNLDVFEPTQDELDRIGDADEVAQDEALDFDEAPTMTRDDLHENLHEHVSIDDDLEDEPLQETEPEQVATADDSNDGLSDYVFDIQETADALEMDVATIQDFVDDFILQAKDFKPKLYEAVEDDDVIELKSLSHQLKGVAANLRIHDAQDVLIDINKAEDFTYSIRDLDRFYNIIAKLAGEEPEVKQKTPEIKQKAPVINEPEIEEKPMDITNEIADVEDEPLGISDELDDTPEIASVEDEPLEINDNEFDMLDIEQEQLIDNNEKNDLLDEIEEKTTQQTYNKMSVANEIGLDEDSFNELFEDYADESKILISQAQEGINADQFAVWQDAARKLKGMSDNMRVTSLESNLEALIKLQDSSNAQKLLNEINETLISVLESKD